MARSDMLSDMSRSSWRPLPDREDLEGEDILL